MTTAPPLRSIETPRLRLVAGTALLHAAELEHAAALAPLLGAEVPDEWPPADSEYDRDAIGFFLKQLTETPDVVGWHSFYVVTREAPARLVANAGYFGPPDETGSVEIGYSVVADVRRRGFASESVGALVASAFARGARRVIAHTRPENAASIAVLTRCGFRPTPMTQRPEMLCFERLAA
jgi:[ribosomal protein S5]-alanine N-acetyltransferase